MRQEIQKEIVEPLESYLNGYLTEKEIEWSGYIHGFYD